MNRCQKVKRPWFGAALALGLRPGTLLACAACYGQSDSSLAQGMNWGILTLLAVVLAVLSSLVAFFIHVARRAADASEASPVPPKQPPVAS